MAAEAKEQHLTSFFRTVGAIIGTLDSCSGIVRRSWQAIRGKKRGLQQDANHGER
jgi:hypothetical protein